MAKYVSTAGIPWVVILDAFEYGIRAVPSVTGNTINGYCDVMLYGCSRVSDNTIAGAESNIGALDCTSVTNNVITGVVRGVDCVATHDYLVSGNRVTLVDDAAGMGIYSHASSTSPVVHAVSNYVDAPNAGAHCFYNSSVMIAVGNMITGAGDFTHATKEPDYARNNISVIRDPYSFVVQTEYTP